MQKIFNNINFDFELTLWQQGYKLVAGVDEVGRGPWAGPVVAAAAIFKPSFSADYLSILNDSKKLTSIKRDFLYPHLINDCDYAIGMASVEEIDQINILQASMLAMMRALDGLKVKTEHALIDGNKLPKDINIPAQAIIKGDARSYSIAAASIIAKVTRDRLMANLHQEHPYYSWHTNMGYGTQAHQIGLAEFGVTKHHRKSFKPVKALLNQLDKK